MLKEKEETQSLCSAVVKSNFDDDCEFSKYTWVVTILKYKKGFGHSVLIVEGLLESGKRFVGHYDVKFKAYEKQDNIFNCKGYISKVMIESSDAIFKKYVSCPSRSHEANADKVKDMIDNIKKDKIQVDKHREYLEGESTDPSDNQPLEYQFIGKNHFFGDSDEGNNCTSWVFEKLEIAGIDDYKNAKPKPDVAKPCYGCNLF